MVGELHARHSARLLLLAGQELGRTARALWGAVSTVWKIPKWSCRDSMLLWLWWKVVSITEGIFFLREGERSSACRGGMRPVPVN